MRTNYFGLEEWYTEMGVEDNAQAAIYTEESANILRKLNLKSFESDYKILVMWLPEKMNPECSNKLLKIIEEPFDKTLFLMVSEHPNRSSIRYNRVCSVFTFLPCIRSKYNDS